MIHHLENIHFPQLSDLFYSLSFRMNEVNHNLEKGDTKSGQLEDWLVKKTFYICVQSKKFKKKLMLKFKIISRACLIFMIAFTVL